LFHFKNVSGTNILDKDEAFALGWFLNDGTYLKKYNKYEFYFTPEKDDQPKKKPVPPPPRIGRKKKNQGI
jgi:hypothetical protein